MIIANNRKQIDKKLLKIVLDGEEIEIINGIKYLGVILDEKFEMNSNIDYICKKANMKTGILKRISKKIDVTQKICIYKTIIAPHFDYCASILFLSNVTQFERLQRIQNRAMRAIVGVNRFTSSELLLNTLEWMSVKQRVYFFNFEIYTQNTYGTST